MFSKTPSRPYLDSMEHKIEKLPKSKILLSITLNAEDMKKYNDKAIAHFAEHIEVKGFRAGKAPKELVAQQVGQNRIDGEASNIAIEDSYGQIVVDNNIDVAGYPKIDLVKYIPSQELEYKAEVAVFPEIKLADYKEIAKSAGKSNRQEVKIEEKEISDALNWLVNSRAKYTKIERPSQKGDLAVVSYEMRLGGVKVENGDQKELPVFLGEEKSFLPGLGEQVLGLKKSDEKEFSLEMPKDFHDSNVAGKTVDLKVKVDDVMQKDLPELNDEFAKSLGKFESLEALKNNLKDGLLSEKTQAEKERFRIILISKIAKESQMELPDIMIESEIDKMIHELQHDVEHRGMQFDNYLEHIKKTKDDLKKEFQEKAAERVKIAMAMREISKAENIKISDEELTTKVTDIIEKFDSLSADWRSKKEDIDQDKLHDYANNILTNEHVFEALEKLAE